MEATEDLLDYSLLDALLLVYPLGCVLHVPEVEVIGSANPCLRAYTIALDQTPFRLGMPPPLSTDFFYSPGAGVTGYAIRLEYSAPRCEVQGTRAAAPTPSPPLPSVWVVGVASLALVVVVALGVTLHTLCCKGYQVSL